MRLKISYNPNSVENALFYNKKCGLLKLTIHGEQLQLSQEKKEALHCEREDLLTVVSVSAWNSPCRTQ